MRTVFPDSSAWCSYNCSNGLPWLISQKRFFCLYIGIGRSLTAPPSHTTVHTDQSHTRRFGRYALSPRLTTMQLPFHLPSTLQAWYRDFHPIRIVPCTAHMPKLNGGNGAQRNCAAPRSAFLPTNSVQTGKNGEIFLLHYPRNS